MYFYLQWQNDDIMILPPRTHRMIINCRNKKRYLASDSFLKTIEEIIIGQFIETWNYIQLTIITEKIKNSIY